MDFQTLAQERYSVRQFSDRRVEKDVLEKILHAGHVAPTACNKQPQRIYVLQRPEAVEKMRKCTVCHFDAPMGLLICYDKTISWKRSYDGQDSGWVDASIVATHMMLAAHELGVGTTWVMYFSPESAIAEFHLPENIVPVALLPMGYPAPDAQPSAMHAQFRPEKDIVTVL